MDSRGGCVVSYCPWESFSRCLVYEGTSVLLGLQLEQMLDTVDFLGSPPCALGSACHIRLPTLTVTVAEQKNRPPRLPLPSRISLVKNNFEDFPRFIPSLVSRVGEGAIFQKNLVFSISN